MTVFARAAPARRPWMPRVAWRRGRLLRWAMGAVLGMGPARGVFIPCRHAWRMRPCTYAPMEEVMAAAEARMINRLDALDGMEADLTAIESASSSGAHGGADGEKPPRWSQDWFPTLDAAMLYGMIRQCRPRRVVEVGAGHSTRFIARALDDGGIDADVHVLDPGPRADISALAARPGWRLARQLLQDALGSGEASPFAGPFAELTAGDVVSMDSSHILMPGSDVDVFLNHVFPALPAGVWIHVHDIFLPDPYPDSWRWRGYNEQNAWAAILALPGVRVEFASHYAATRLHDRLARSVVRRLPDSGAPVSSLWLTKTAAPADAPANIGAGP